MKSGKMEIERKWRLDKLPDRITQHEDFARGYRTITQGYIFDGDCELRLRHEFGTGINNYSIAAKSSGTLVREEWDRPIPQWVFDGLWIHVKHSLVKKRFVVWFLDYSLEFDQYQDKLSGLIILEREFETVELANKCKLPEWIECAVEVTNDPRFKNKKLAALDDLLKLNA